MKILILPFALLIALIGYVSIYFTNHWEALGKNFEDDI